MFSLGDIMQGNDGRIYLQSDISPNPDTQFRSAQHDSRQVGLGDLFVAIKGARVDGHRFLADVVRVGATGALCSELHPELPGDFLQLVVPDVIKALQATARIRVLRQPGTIKIGITGSSGKTTTKEAVATILQSVAPTLKTYASYNTDIGYPLTILRLELDHRYAVLEMGAERVGELHELCNTIANPDWVVITTVGPAHLKQFGSLENVARAKSELVQALPKDGVAMLNIDDLAVQAMQKQTQARVIFYGRSERAAVRAEGVEKADLFGSQFTLHIENKKIHVRLWLPGEQGITIALAAATVGYVAGLPIENIGSILETLRPMQGRGEVKEGAGPNGSTLIDDTYNAVRPAIVVMVRAMSATTLVPGGQRWAVLGELLEQGKYTQVEHYSTGLELPANIDYLVTIGDLAKFYGEGATRAGMPADHIYHFPVDPQNTAEVEARKQEVAALLKQKVTAKDLVLVKGSNDMRMETLFSMF